MIERVRGDPAGTNRGEGGILAKRRALALSLLVLGVAAPAEGSDGLLPWSGGAARVSPFEGKASKIASSLAGRTVSIDCADTATWAALSARYGFDPTRIWALTPLHWDSAAGQAVPDEQAELSRRVCRFGDAFATKPTERGARICQHGTTTRSRELPGNPDARRMRKVVVRVPVYGECDDWAAKLRAVHVVAHESMHLAGVVDEAVADCLAVQLDAHVATALGAAPRFARSLAREYWKLYYPVQDARYRSRHCRDAGGFDLFPEQSGWPTPARYPQDLASRIEALEVATRPPVVPG